MTTLRHLAEEICVGLQIYVAGRSGTFLKTAFLLCDDYTELATKMYLTRRDPAWQDQADGRFKNYHRVLDDLLAVIDADRGADSPAIREYHERMKARRARRNLFFHSTTLLDLQVTGRDTAVALVDLLDYCDTLFPEWGVTASSVADLESLSLFVRLDAATSSDGTLLAQVNELLERQPRNRRPRPRGSHVTVFPEDLYALLSIRWGGAELREAFRTLLSR